MPLLRGKKTVTRRDWNDKHAQLFINAFRKGQLIEAYDKSPRHGGRKVANIRLIEKPRTEPLSAMTMADVEDEGGLWGSVAEFTEAFIEGNALHHYEMTREDLTEDTPIWVIRFELVDIEPSESDQMRLELEVS